MASGKYEADRNAFHDRVAIRQAVKNRAGVPQEGFDLPGWEDRFPQDIALGDLHRMLTGMQ